MGEIARLEGRWHAATGPMTASAASFEEFFDAERDRVLRAFCVITASRAEAEDIVQEAFTRIYERWDAVSTMEEPSAYLYRTATNISRSQYRRLGVALRRAVSLGPERDVFQAVEDRDLAAHALASLTPRQRAAFVLTEGLGYSGEEAAEMLGIKPSTVRALTYQARKALDASRGESSD
jgi:RNA polymerase sigma factor (sigma-70 family)